MRPQKTRHIESPPPWERYLPEGRRQAAEVTLGLDMFEALRLVDAEGLPQEAAAGRMGVSTPTLCRLLGEARRRVATALRDGWTLRCEGGNVQMRSCAGHGHGAPGRHGRVGPACGVAAATETDSERAERPEQPAADSPDHRFSHGRHGRLRRRAMEDGSC